MAKFLEQSGVRGSIGAEGTNQSTGIERGHLSVSPGRIITLLGGLPLSCESSQKRWGTWGAML